MSHSRELFNREDVFYTLDYLFDPGEVFEIRILNGTTQSYRRKRTFSGYFDDPSKARASLAEIKSASGIYVTMNPVNPALLSRYENRFQDGAKITTSDHDIPVRKLLVIDVDPIRPAGISSSDTEHEHAKTKAYEIAADMTEIGFPPPAIADSGNGWHVIYGIDLPVADYGIVKRYLEVVATRYNDEHCTVDTTLHNPARIIKLYGTLACKGDNTDERPWRMSQFYEAPEPLVVLRCELIEQYIAENSKESHAKQDGRRSSTKSQNSRSIEKWMADHGIEHLGVEDYRNGKRCKLKKCPFNEEHVNGDAMIGELANGAKYFKCLHNSCADKTWQDVRELLGPCGDRANGNTTKLPSSHESIRPLGVGTTRGASVTKILADEICGHDHFAKNAGGKMFRFNDGAYRENGEAYIRRRVKQLLIKWQDGGKWTRRQAEEVVEYIGVDCPAMWERPPSNIVNLRNGLLNVETRELRPHSPNHLSPIQLPVVYDPTATCRSTEKFVSEVFPTDAYALAWEIIAWLMLPNTDIQKAVLLIGEGGNGKSTWLAQVISFLGKSNTSGVPLHRLESDRFAAVRLFGKLANVCPDLPSEHLSGTSVFKSLTGGDVMQGEYKFKDSFDFEPFARLVFSANHPPRSVDASQAFFNRWIVIPFERRFRDESAEIPRSDLDELLSSPSELSGVLNHALDALPRLKDGFSQPASVVTAGREFHATTDPLAVWLDRYTVDDPEAMVRKSDLRAAYGAECERRGRPPLSDKAFGLAIKKHRPNVQDRQRTLNGRKNQHCYVGIGLRTQLENEQQGQRGQQDSPFLV